MRFTDGSEVKADVVVYCTGYKVTFPFFDEGFLSAPDNDLPLFRRTFHPDIPNVFFVGLLQPLGAIMPIAEAQGEWVSDYLSGRYALPAPADLRADMEDERRRMFKRYVASKRHTMQVDFDDWMAALAKERKAGAERANGTAPGPAPRGHARRRVTAPLGRREATKAANRAAILAAGRDVFSELGYGAAGVRDIVRRTELAAGTFYNYFPDKESVFRALVHEVGAEARRRVRAARQAAATPRAFVEDAYRAYFSFIVEDAGRAAFLSRNSGAIRAMFEESEAPAGIDELAADLRAAIAAGLVPELDVELCAASMVAVALELGERLTEQRRARRGARPRASHGPVSCRYRARVVKLLLLLAALHVGIGENKPDMFSDPLFSSLGVKQVRRRRLLRRDDERRRRAPARHRVPARRAGGGDRAAGHVRARARRGRDLREAQEPPQAPVPAAVGGALPARVQAVPQALRVRALLRAVERDQPLHAADLAQPEGGGEVHPDRAQELLRLQGRRRRRARPGRPSARQEADLPPHAGATSRSTGARCGRRARSAGCTTTPTSTASATPARRRSSRRSAASRSG